MQGLMKLEERAGHTAIPFAMHDAKNDGTPWSRYFVSPLDTSRPHWGLGALSQAKRALWSTEAKTKMGRLIDDFRPDVVHAHNLYTHLSPSPLAACKERGVPVVMTVNDYGIVSANYGLWGNGRPVDPQRAGILSTTRSRFIKHSAVASFTLASLFAFQRLWKMYESYVDVFVPCSQFVRDALITVGYPADRIVVQHLFAEPFMVDEAYPAERKKKFVLFAGRLEDYKGVQTLIEAGRALPDVEIRIVGTGPQEAMFRKMAGSAANIRFVGFVPGRQLWGMMREAVAVVVPSIWYEPFGLVAVEAMAQSTPVIVSDRGGLPEIVQDGVSGLVFKGGDAKDLRKKIELLLGDAKKCQTMGKAARERAWAISNPQEHLAKIIDLYIKVQAGPNIHR
ncbi:MAG: Glycosyl transferase group 1 [Candidatus Uhrbacteria bacterium GW2011_GWD2_52_7]|uniref:Glycosyl transferase group 1 n=1 Tax=Candidatus Uhrbacteria bacterium GW2011_GWD2_52_7 TaxID=1618989 RepID=A0A0G2ACS8_9BACT|nr:MAG: Glycosyl transferase group 1 [Candidatus Uhrbacteria bacterium GW2011_GWD2_52_7]